MTTNDSATQPEPSFPGPIYLFGHDHIKAEIHNGHRAIRIWDHQNVLILVLPDGAAERRNLSQMLAGALVLAEALEIPPA